MELQDLTHWRQVVQYCMGHIHHYLCNTEEIFLKKSEADATKVASGLNISQNMKRLNKHYVMDNRIDAIKTNTRMQCV